MAVTPYPKSPLPKLSPIFQKCDRTVAKSAGSYLPSSLCLACSSVFLLLMMFVSILSSTAHPSLDLIMWATYCGKPFTNGKLRSPASRTPSPAANEKYMCPPRRSTCTCRLVPFPYGKDKLWQSRILQAPGYLPLLCLQKTQFLRFPIKLLVHDAAIAPSHNCCHLSRGHYLLLLQSSTSHIYLRLSYCLQVQGTVPVIICRATAETVR